MAQGLSHNGFHDIGCVGYAINYTIATDAKPTSANATDVSDTCKPSHARSAYAIARAEDHSVARFGVVLRPAPPPGLPYIRRSTRAPFLIALGTRTHFLNRQPAPYLSQPKSAPCHTQYTGQRTPPAATRLSGPPPP